MFLQKLIIEASIIICTDIFLHVIRVTTRMNI
jgi:hypothetical protein